MDSIDEFEQELYDGVDVWDDDDIEKSLSMFFMFFLTETVGRRRSLCEPPPLVFTVQLHHSS